MKITTEMLREKQACSDQVAVFEAEWPKGAETTKKNWTRAAELKLSVTFLERFLSPTALKEYREIRRPALREYEKIILPARKEYYKIIRAVKIRLPAMDEYEKIKQAALKEYDNIEQPAWKEYEKIILPALFQALAAEKSTPTNPS